MPRFPELAASLGESLDLPVPLPARKDHPDHPDRPAGQVKIYSIAALDAETWAKFTAKFTALRDKALAATDDDEEIADDKSEESIHRRALGPIYDELAQDGASWKQIRACGLTAMAWHVHGEEAAMEIWERGGVPKPPSTSTSSESPEIPAEAPSTPSPASASTTTRSRRARASSGPGSSNTGPS